MNIFCNSQNNKIEDKKGYHEYNDKLYMMILPKKS